MEYTVQQQPANEKKYDNKKLTYSSHPRFNLKKNKECIKVSTFFYHVSNKVSQK